MREGTEAEPGNGKHTVMTGFLGEHYPSAAAQAVFVRLVHVVTIRVALREAENRVIQTAAFPPGELDQPSREPSS